MTLQVEFWQLVTLLLAFLGASAGAGKLLLNQMQAHLDQRFSHFDNRLLGIEQTHKEEATEWRRVEREMLELKAALPDAYVRREDYIRGQTVLEHKLDSLAMKLENVQLRTQIGAKKDGHSI